MQFDYLKVFCDVARVHSFSQAALANDITQSAVSQIVSQLEKRLDVRLVDRSVRPLRLTPAGQAYFEGCQDILRQYAELEDTIRSAQERVAGAVRVAAIYSVGLSDMGQYVQKLTALHAKVQVHFDYLHPDAVYERVLEGSVDLGLVSFPRKSPKLAAIPWRDETMVLACAPMHPLARRGAIRPEELSGQKYIHFDKKLVIRRRVDRFLRAHHVAVEVAFEFDNIENIKQAVGLGNGVALLPEPTLRREVKTGDLLALPLVDVTLTRPLGIIHRRRHALNRAARLFVDLLLAETGKAAVDGRAANAPTLESVPSTSDAPTDGDTRLSSFAPRPPLPAPRMNGRPHASPRAGSAR